MPTRCATRFIIAGILASAVTVFGEQRMIDVGGRHLSVYCDGAGTPTVVLIPAGGRTAADWTEVQPAVSSFTRVCSYDHAGTGASEEAPTQLQSVDEVADELHAWLKASGEKGPFVLVSHSIAGFYARRFATRYPSELAGLVFVDSSHEEQAVRLHELDPEGPPLNELTAKLGFFVERGRRLEWGTELSLIVLGRGKPFPRRARDGSDSETNRMSEEQFAAWDRIWREFQNDLAKRSPRGEFRLAENSGHFIQKDQPELVIQAIRDVSRDP